MKQISASILTASVAFSICLASIGNTKFFADNSASAQEIQTVQVNPSCPSCNNHLIPAQFIPAPPVTFLPAPPSSNSVPSNIVPTNFAQLADPQSTYCPACKKSFVGDSCLLCQAKGKHTHGIIPNTGIDLRKKVVQAKSYEAELWTWLQKAQYKNWAAAPGQAEGVYPGQSPHGAFLKMYLNRKASANFKTLPHGSVIIKENFGKDGTTLMAITVMYRSKGFNPKAFDWYWVKYNADGTVARTPADKGNKKIAGKFSKCIECHSSAKGNDFSFINDSLQ